MRRLTGLTTLATPAVHAALKPSEKQLRVVANLRKVIADLATQDLVNGVDPLVVEVAVSKWKEWIEEWGAMVVSGRCKSCNGPCSSARYVEPAFHKVACRDCNCFVVVRRVVMAALVDCDESSL
jgi:hypothetical protein